MRTIQEGDKGIGDLKALTYVRRGTSETVRPTADRRPHRTVVGLIVAVLLIACAQYVALKIINETQPAHVTRGK
ncbi:hypothetical protein L0Z31_27060 [Burkholderia vietnamiensis]|uniref:hypothetical protein n=1 Tax=Burkholderia vietnamiensis TaxID=60552 RepID=UPI0020187780|nr:hypothetical protein [Burkholderia vietnamiensis]MCO1351220.1 hypothetical protein [Burkholderia vietnamiensis]MCO1433577.1 hypothetical protein [Burkholderia vietnamiensis]UQN48235.1 hypothetical protein L0Y95_17300 [Burkholderia vietnamiensis]HDR9021953.1 hypothetical protein [Burkholderia vietnamiensis]HDR9260128.1 hypothetical protein [Burkholderia vietnamiensis]